MKLQDLETRFLADGMGLQQADCVKLFVDGAYVDGNEQLSSDRDIKAEIKKDGKTRMVDLSAGIAYTLPSTDVKADYSIARCRTKVSFENSVLLVSNETQNPYEDRPDPWFIYGDEWLMRRVNNDELLKNCNLVRLNGTRSYPFSEGKAFGDLTMKEGYDVYRYDILIEDNEGIERPYYNIAVIRKADDPLCFALFVMKSDRDHGEEMDAIVKSFTRFSPYGTAKNYFRVAPVPDPMWSKETRAYYEQLSSCDKTQWGVFSYSMPGLEEELSPSNCVYQDFLEKSQRMERAIENMWKHPFDIYPTYTHIGAGTKMHYFPLKMARELAGGNGVNGKPVLQFTYQFTTNNNLVYENVTPMFDILRGKYDEHFRRLARDIKEYSLPVLFRLNNEMNSDWTSYCGMMTLLDPEIFNMTWIRLYNIFKEEGVNNAIWIWNPIATSCPYSGWGEGLCYFPGVEYVHLLGGTSYEMNNYSKEEAEKQIITFQAHYQRLYEKNKASFPQWSMVLSEFACGSGGDCSGELGRNGAVQAKWVHDMFEWLNAEEKADWVVPIKGAIWFNCNDWVGDKVSNRLRFIDPDSDHFSDLSQTRESFRKGFQRENR